MNVENLQSKLKQLADNGGNLRKINYVRLNDDYCPYLTHGEVIIKAGTEPEIVCQLGIIPWLRYGTNVDTVKISKTALLGAGHFAKSSVPCSYRHLECRTKYNGIRISDAWDVETVSVNGVDYAIAIPKVDIKVTFSNGGRVYVPSEMDGAEVVSFIRKEKYALLTISKA